jgi:methyl-accepting chemotaxis protein
VRISLKLTLAFSVLVAFVIAMGFLGMKYIGDIHRSLENVSNNALPSVRYSGAIRAEALDFRNRETQLLLVKNAKEMSELESKLAVTLGNIKKNEQNYELLPSRDEEKAVYAAYKNQLALYLASHDKFVKIVVAGDHDASMAYFRGEGRKVFRGFLPTIDDLLTLNIKSAESSRVLAEE